MSAVISCSWAMWWSETWRRRCSDAAASSTGSIAMWEREVAAWSPPLSLAADPLSWQTPTS
eukprot:251291-Prymnesium_polylepis.1